MQGRAFPGVLLLGGESRAQDEWAVQCHTALRFDLEDNRRPLKFLVRLFICLMGEMDQLYSRNIVMAAV